MKKSRAGQTKFKLFSLIFSSLAVLLAAGCGGNGTSTSTNSNGTGITYVVGTDAPLAAVTSFQVQVKSIDAVDASGNEVPLLGGSPTVDFARYNGLQTLLDLNDVPAGTYNSIKVTLGSATIGYLSTQPGAAPTIQTVPAVLSQSTIQVTLGLPLIVSKVDPVGLYVDFDLRKSIQLDSNGQVTGQVTPTFDATAATPPDAGAYIDEFEAAVVSVDTAGKSFVVEGPHGRQVKVEVSPTTSFDNGESLSALTRGNIVQISGMIDQTTGNFRTDEVAILSQDGFYAGGLVTDVQPPSGAATGVDLYVRGVLPATTGVTDGQIAHVNLTGSEKFFIWWMQNPMTQFVFNASSLLPGQLVSVGGPAAGAANAQAVNAKRVVLRPTGFNGTEVAGSTFASSDTFQMNVTGFAGQLMPGPVTVNVDRVVRWTGLEDMFSVEDHPNVRVVGLLVKDPQSGKPVILAHYVDALN